MSNPRERREQSYIIGDNSFHDRTTTIANRKGQRIVAETLKTSGGSQEAVKKHDQAVGVTCGWVGSFPTGDMKTSGQFIERRGKKEAPETICQ